MVVSLVVIGCTETATPESDDDRAPSLSPTETFYPVVPTEVRAESIGRSEPTSAALAAEGEPSLEPADIPEIPTLESLPLQFFSQSGQIIEVMFYGASARPAPGIALLQVAGEDHAWHDVARQLQATGYEVFVTDLRGHVGQGASWEPLTADVALVLQRYLELGEIVNGRIVLVGAGNGANLAIAACPTTPACAGVVAISVRPDVPGLDLGLALETYTTQFVLLVSADDDLEGTVEADRLNSRMNTANVDHRWQRYTIGGQGMQLLVNQPDLQLLIDAWLAERLPVAAP
ncbi:MAG: hypothetical protein GYB66_16585 [Chloroflexi bacterium]|nr:hypothetical protein [Chloroflexota bacterium]